MSSPRQPEPHARQLLGLVLAALALCLLAIAVSSRPPVAPSLPGPVPVATSSASPSAPGLPTSKPLPSALPSATDPAAGPGKG